MTKLTEDSFYDLIVIGGGPAGSTVATLVASSGHRVLLLERASEPTFKIGESLMPATYWTFQRLGMLERLRASDFPRKHSVQFYGHSGKASAPFYFSENDPHESSVTWQVLRSEFDQMLLDNAAQHGAEVVRGAAVQQVLFDGHRAAGVEVRSPDGQVCDLRSRIVADASGQSALLARKLALKRVDPELKKASIFTHFRGATRDPGIDEGATLVLLTESKDSWFWSIPLANDCTSIGVVGSLDYLLQNRSEDAQQVFDDELTRCRPLLNRLEGAEQLFPVRVTQDFSYRARQLAGEGWLLVGDAYGFLDPIYSSGVFLALKTGEWAADTICEAFEQDDLSGSRLGTFAGDVESAMGAVRNLVQAFYTKEFSFSRFLQRYPHCKQGIVDILSGNVFSDSVPTVFGPLREMCGVELVS
jgi:flavin-dependent dehydrogenase